MRKMRLKVKFFYQNLKIFVQTSFPAQSKGQRAKVSRLVGVLGRASAVLNGPLILNLYNALVLPHLQYCLIVWGDFEEGRNKVLGENLLRYQKKFAGMIASRSGTYHSDPIFSQ